MDAEWDILYNKLSNIVKSGAKVVLSKLPIGDVATQYFADRYVCGCGRVCGRPGLLGNVPSLIPTSQWHYLVACTKRGNYREEQ